MMLTARFKTCALAAFLLAACLLLPDTQAKAESISLPEPIKASQTQPEAAAEKTESVPVLTTLSYETVVETIEEPAPEAAPETPEETPAPEDAQEQAFMKNELTATVQMPGGAKANVKSGPGLLRKVNNRTRETTEERVFMLDLDLYMDSKIELNHTAPALNIVHDNAGSLFRAAITDTLADAMEPQKA